MGSAVLIQIAALIGAAGAALALIGRRPLLIAAGFLLLAAAEGMLAYAVAPTRDVNLLFAGSVRIGAVALGLLAFVGLTAALVRFPYAVPIVVVCVAPFRIPVDVAGTDAFLLVPLYLVLGAASLAFLIRIVRERHLTAPPLAVAVPAAMLIAWAALSSLWSLDVEAGAVELLFFYFPFAALVAVVTGSPLERYSARALAATAIGLSVGLAAVGLWQLESHNLFFAHDLEIANSYSTYFRTTSLFHDSSIYGRHLVLGILVIIVALWLDRIGLAIGVTLVAFLATALFFTYSQSSMVALAVSLVFVAFLAADRRSKTIILAAALVLVVTGGAVVASTAKSESLRRVTSGRSDLVANASEIAAQHPLGGVGIAAEQRAVNELVKTHPGRLKKVTHTTPLAIAAELGGVGVAIYVGFLAGAARVLLVALRRSRAFGIALAAAFVSIFVHSLFYSGFFEDAIVWLTVAVAGALAVAPRAAEAPARSPVVAAGVGDPALAKRRTQI